MREVIKPSNPISRGTGRNLCSSLVTASSAASSPEPFEHKFNPYILHPSHVELELTNRIVTPALSYMINLLRRLPSRALSSAGPRESARNYVGLKLTGGRGSFRCPSRLSLDVILDLIPCIMLPRHDIPDHRACLVWLLRSHEQGQLQHYLSDRFRVSPYEEHSTMEISSHLP